MLLMLNCNNRPHAHLYKRQNAFFDLSRERHEAEMQLLFEHAVCCVISYADLNQKQGRVVLSFWIHEESLEGTVDGEPVWYMIGRKIGETTILKSELANHPHFPRVIAADGDFNQFSVRPLN